MNQPAPPITPDTKPEARRVFVLTLRPLTTGWRASPDQRLKVAVKVLLRSFGMRLITIREDYEQ